MSLQAGDRIEQCYNWEKSLFPLLSFGFEQTSLMNWDTSEFQYTWWTAQLIQSFSIFLSANALENVPFCKCQGLITHLNQSVNWRTTMTLFIGVHGSQIKNCNNLQLSLWIFIYSWAMAACDPSLEEECPWTVSRLPSQSRSLLILSHFDALKALPQ